MQAAQKSNNKRGNPLSLLDIRVCRFVLVGSLGFLIDALLLWFWHHYFSLVIARSMSFLLATSVTWWLNRRFTFRSQDPNYSSEWLRYMLVYGVGGGLNFLSFLALVQRSSVMHHYPLLALAIVSIAVAFFNYTLSRLFAFNLRGVKS